MKCQLFIRWKKEGEDVVELVQDGVVVQKSGGGGNRERIYGYCRGVVDTLSRIGVKIEMPACLQQHLGPNTNRED